MNESSKDRSSWQPWFAATVLLAAGALARVATYAGIFDANSTVGRLILALGELISLAGLIWIISLYLPIIMPRKK
jgi:hypothetical protein